MGMREKLIVLIQSAVGGCATYWAGLIADHLIANGVTIQKWIPVSERLPEKEGTYIVRTTTGAVTTARFYEEWDMTNYRGDFIKHVEAKFHRNATHWMPLPEPPAIDK